MARSSQPLERYLCVRTAGRQTVGETAVIVISERRMSYSCSSAIHMSRTEPTDLIGWPVLTRFRHEGSGQVCLGDFKIVKHSVK